MDGKKTMCVGIIARRAADGSFLPAEPIIREISVDDLTDRKRCDMLAVSLANKFRQYMESCAAAEAKNDRHIHDRKQI